MVVTINFCGENVFFFIVMPHCISFEIKNKILRKVDKNNLCYKGNIHSLVIEIYSTATFRWFKFYSNINIKETRILCINATIDRMKVEPTYHCQITYISWSMCEYTFLNKHTLWCGYIKQPFHRNFIGKPVYHIKRTV